MPTINIYENDNTGVEYTGGESVVFIPGPVPFKTADGGLRYEDNNNCYYFSTSDLSKMKDVLNLSDADQSDEKLGTLALIESCLKNNLDVIYCYVKGYASGDIYASTDVPTLLPEKLDFLQDKDSYNVKFLTTGYFNAITSIIGKKDGGGTIQPATSILSDSVDGEVAYFNFANINKLLSVARGRQDCVVITGADVDTSKVGDGDIFAGQLSKALGEGEANETNHVYGEAGFDATNGSYGAIIVPNFNTTVTVDCVSISKSLLMPSCWAYLQKYGKSIQRGQEWMPLANSTRGSVAELGNTSLKMTKYYFDQNIIKDEGVSSFNGIVTLRPYGNVIWGDRTLLKLTNSVKATGYLSLRLLVCDVVKRAYQSAVRYTYESNNDVTWFNFKSRISELLGEMVASGVLQTYSIKKSLKSEANSKLNPYNTIIAKITLVPNLPVENFDIYINIENAELEAEE